MKKKSCKPYDKFVHSRGMTIVEMVIVVLIIGVLAAASIPQLLASRRLLSFSGIQQQLTVNLRDARQQAMSQSTRITLRYDDTAKVFRIYGGTLGIVGANTNRVVPLTNGGLLPGDIQYGVAPISPTPSTSLADTTSLSVLSTNPAPGGFVEVTFNARGDVVEDATGAPVNRALFFYENNSRYGFAVSILGPGGRVRIWKLRGSTYE